MHNILCKESGDKLARKTKQHRRIFHIYALITICRLIFYFHFANLLKISENALSQLYFNAIPFIKHLYTSAEKIIESSNLYTNRGNSNHPSKYSTTGIKIQRQQATKR